MRKHETLPEPDRVNSATIGRCQAEIEGRSKRLVRALILPLVRWYYGFYEIGEGFQWGRPLGLRGGRLRIGRHVYIGAHAAMVGPVVIGDLSLLSTHVRIVGNDHRPDVVGSPTRLEFSDDVPLTVIESDCWIGKGATLIAGITIGRGSVVAAGAVVTRSVAPYSVVAGVPARPIKARFTPTEIVTHEAAVYGEASEGNENVHI